MLQISTGNPRTCNSYRFNAGSPGERSPSPRAPEVVALQSSATAWRCRRDSDSPVTPGCPGSPDFSRPARGFFRPNSDHSQPTQIQHRSCTEPRPGPFLFSAFRRPTTSACGLLVDLVIASQPRLRETLQPLRAELERADVLPAEVMLPSVVVMGSRVEIEDRESGEVDAYTLVYPEQAAAAAGRLSILAPIGTAMHRLCRGRHVCVAHARRHAPAPDPQGKSAGGWLIRLGQSAEAKRAGQGLRRQLWPRGHNWAGRRILSGRTEFKLRIDAQFEPVPSSPLGRSMIDERG
ncbi:MAG: hypothetical protein EXS43_03785 [Opitutus sp.]|nr:hypothetical protein [Opitutus sp.]